MLRAFFTGIAFREIHPVLTIHKRVNLRPYFGTLFTSAAHVGVKSQLRLKGLGFRIMTPFAGKGASLQKYRGADARPVMHGAALDIKNYAVLLNVKHNNSTFLI